MPSRSKRFKIPWTDIGSTLLQVLFGVLYPAIAISVYFYFIRYVIAVVNGKPVTSPIQLAAVTATTGSLILGAAFNKEKDPDKAGREIARNLKRTAKFLLAATVCLVIIFLLRETASAITTPTLTFGDRFIAYLAAFTMAASAITLGLGLAYLVALIPHL